MTIVDTTSSKRKRLERVRLRQRGLSSSGDDDTRSELITDQNTDPTPVSDVTLVLDTNLVPENAKNAKEIFKDKTFLDELKTTSTFFYGKVWFYNAVLEFLLGKKWGESKEVQIIHYAKGFGKPTAQAKPNPKPLVILPAVHDQVSLNMLVSKALETERPVWFIGYPSTLSKHLLISFQSLFLCSASENELKILSDVAELSTQDTEFLKQPKSGIYISKENAKSIHMTF